MATLYITEFLDMALTGNGQPVPIARYPAIANQTVAIGGSHAESGAFQKETRFVRLHCDAICSIKIDSSPTASTLIARLAANQTEYFGVSGGHKVSVISNT